MSHDNPNYHDRLSNHDHPKGHDRPQLVAAALALGVVMTSMLTMASAAPDAGRSPSGAVAVAHTHTRNHTSSLS
jgi:hypothetical protein